MKSKRRGHIVLLIASFLITLFLLEIASRTWLNYFATPEQQNKYFLYNYIQPENHKWAKHHYLNYYPNPNYKRGLTYHNSLGYRNKEFPLKKPSGVFRIAALGGSSIYTTSVEDNEKTFTAQLENVLRDKYEYNNVEVINAGAGGYNSWESLINLQFRVLDLAPDLVIVYHGINDVHARFVDPSAYRGDNSGRRKQWEAPSVPILEHSCLFRILFKKSGVANQIGIGNFVSADTFLGYYIEDYDPIEILKKNPPAYFRRNLNNMITIAKANDVKIMFATWAHSPFFNDYLSFTYRQKAIKENNEVVREVAISNDIPLFNYSDLMPKDQQYWADGRHVNEQGALFKAGLFAQFIHESGLISN